MARGREYAEGLVGPLDRSFYETQRNVSKQTSETNWKDLQNQYKNLQAKLKKEQEQANRNFANGLVQVAEGSLDRMNSANDAMARSGLSVSGLNNLMQQADTTRKGEQVLDLLEKSGDVAVNAANELSSANTTVAKKQANLADALSDALGDIGAADTSAQMAYNQGLANIGEAMEAREAENDLQAKQRAANAAAIARSKELQQWEDDLDELYRKKAISDVLSSEDLTDEQKSLILGTLYDIQNSADVVQADNIYTGKFQLNSEEQKEMEKVYDEYHTQNGLANNSIKMQQALIDGDFSYEKEGRDLYNYMRYKTLMDVGKTEQAKELYVSEKDAQKALDAVYSAMANTAEGKKEYNLAKGDGAKPTLETLWKMYRYDGDRSKIESVAKSYSTYDAYNDKLSEKMSYKDLAELLYGKK